MKKKSKLILPKFKTFVWLKGIIDGKTGVASLGEMQIIESGEILMYQKHFQKFAREQIRLLDEELYMLLAEGQKILYQLNKSIPLNTEIKPVLTEANAIKIRAGVRASEEKKRIISDYYEQKDQNIRRLIDVKVTYSEKVLSCQERIKEVVAAIEEILVVYCKGVLGHRTLLKENIPTVNSEEEMTVLHQKLARMNEMLMYYPEREKKYEDQ